MIKRTLLLGILSLSWPAAAQVPMVGGFVAEATCAATPAIRDAANPGDVATEAGRRYELVGRNAVPGSHYLILVPGMDPERRWVPYGCGRIEEASGGTGFGELPADESGVDEYVLAASWQPAFCERRPRVAECRTGATDRDGFTLHGLWPQPRSLEYCGVPTRIRETDESGDWRALPSFELTTETRRALAAAMPGVASGLDRHEWWKHGTCFPGDAEEYYAVSLRLLDALNASTVRDLVQGSIGRSVTAEEVRAAFDQAFGAGAGRRVTLECTEADGRRLLLELRIALTGAPGDDFASMIRAAPERERGCPQGEVDSAGFI